MATSIKELIEQVETIEARRRVLHDIETSVGTITVRQPTRAIAAEAVDLADSDAYIVVECTVEPNLKDRELQKAFGCLEPTDIPGKLFLPGEVTAIARKIYELAGYRKDLRSVVHETAKN